MIMKKCIISIVVIVSMLFAVSCSMLGSTTQKYLDALNNTQNAETMQVKTEQKISIDLSKASDEVKEALESFKEIRINIDETLDMKNNKMESNHYVSAGSFASGFKIYADGDDVFLKANDKYVKLEPEDGEFLFYEGSGSEKEYEKFYNELALIWKESVEKEILASEGNSIKSTPDGDIKVTQLSLELNDEKTKNILDSLAKMASKSEVLKKSSIEYSRKYLQAQGDEDDSLNKKIEEIKGCFDNLPENMQKYKEKFSVERLKLTAKIDKDSYIIDEIFEGEVVIKHEGEIRISFNINTTRWNINRDVKVEIPEIKEEDLMDKESYDKEIVEMYREIYEEMDNE